MTESAEPRARCTHVLADLTPLRTSPDYRRLWFGNTVSWIGQGMTALAVSLQVYDITGSASSVGLIGFCSLVPLAVFGLTRNIWLGLLHLALAGCADTVSVVFRNTMLQAAVPDELRGRLQGVFIVVVAGGPRLGDFLAGSVADLASPAVAVTGGGILCVTAVTLLALKWRAFARYDDRDPQP
ncbi:MULTISPECIES: MFS transporter [unclassified Streptomyces]|uniref:MFS transporter n=1 Tax=unclassified Streptomyces TaxID=2593676 RepID=UPI0024A83875|nr:MULTISPECIES: MFS transporter [unclassified Streptomyces]